MIFQSQRVLITGGTGSLGKTLCRRILSGERGSPHSVTVMSRDEAKQHFMRQEFAEFLWPKPERKTPVLRFRIGDVRRYDDVADAVTHTDIVINAAALKQVPSCEYEPEQAILTNCQGPINLVRAVRHCSPAHTIIGVSTDKACEPVNCMGMTKALQERIFIAANLRGLGDRPRFLCVRYGNVLASRGSVIPLFKEQILSGGPVTVTIPFMTRFLLSLNQAVDTIFAAIKKGGRGEVWVPRAPAATIENIAKALIEDRLIKIVETGIRPGEKIHECLVSEAERWRTRQAGGFLVIGAAIPELAKPTDASEVIPGPYYSLNEQIGLPETRALLAKHGLLDDSLRQSVRPELLA